MTIKQINYNRTYYALLLFLFCIVGVTKGFAYDFSVVCSTGQTLYYNIIDATNHCVKLTSPEYYSWEGFTKPTGNITLPSSVIYNETTYTVTTIGSGAFTTCSDLTGTLSIPNTITTIENQARILLFRLYLRR